MAIKKAVQAQNPRRLKLLCLSSMEGPLPQRDPKSDNTTPSISIAAILIVPYTKEIILSISTQSQTESSQQKLILHLSHHGEPALKLSKELLETLTKTISVRFGRQVLPWETDDGSSKDRLQQISAEREFCAGPS